MLCTFASLEALKQFSCEDEQVHRDAVVFQASSTEESEASSFFGLLLNKANVAVVHDNRSVEDLKEKFPSVDTSIVDSVWKGQQSWGACFDILNSLRCSTDSKTLLLEDCTFLLDAISWPTLAQSQTKTVHSSHWTIASVQPLSEALNKLKFAESLDSWEILQPGTPLEADPATATTSDPVVAAEAPKRGTVRSYREALLKSPSKEQAAVADPNEGARKKLAQWKPSIVVQSVKYEHKDKLYQHNLPAGAIVSAYELDDEDDSFDAGSYFQSNEYAKGMVSVNRMRSATMLKPAALEKKMARIASRAALRPPVPGAAAGDDEGDSD